MIRRLAVLLVIFGAAAGPAAAQGGQLCVRAYEDRNANGRLDAGEPLLTRGVGANLLSADGVIIASAVLDTSPTAAQGVMCFQQLAEGQYSLSITSADYTPTTLDTITTAISATGLPTVVEFGGQRALAPTPSPAVESPLAALGERDQLIRLALAALGALAAVTVMALAGAVVYALAFRQRPPAADDRRRTTGSTAAVSPRDTGEFPRG